MRSWIGVALLALTVPVAAAPMTDGQVKRAIIQQSIAGYPGNCPCPFNTDRAGRSCGRRSAYSRPGGFSPICYESQVSPAMVRRYRTTYGR